MSRADPEAANALPHDGNMIVETRFTSKGRSDVAAGLTPQGVMASAPTDEEIVRSRISGRHVERIGEYKVWKIRNGELAFRHFRLGDMVADLMGSTTAPEFRLRYVPETLTPLGVGVVRYEPGLKLGFIQMMRMRVESVHGTCEGAR